MYTDGLFFTARDTASDKVFTFKQQKKSEKYLDVCHAIHTPMFICTNNVTIDTIYKTKRGMKKSDLYFFKPDKGENKVISLTPAFDSLTFTSNFFYFEDSPEGKKKAAQNILYVQDIINNDLLHFSCNELDIDLYNVGYSQLSERKLNEVLNDHYGMVFEEIRFENITNVS